MKRAIGLDVAFYMHLIWQLNSAHENATFTPGLTVGSRELKQRRRCRRRRQVKNEFIFYQRNLRLSRSVRFANGAKFVLKDDFQSVLRSLRTLVFINIINGSLDGMQIDVIR